MPALETLKGLDLVPKLVVTRPRAGLRESDDSNPVYDWASEAKIETVRSRAAFEPELHERITDLKPDLLLVVEYGEPLPTELLDVATRGAIELHPSLLPKLRGAHALRAALAGGDSKTGISVFQVAEEPWGGPILFQEELEIENHESFSKLLPRVEELAGDLLIKALKKVDRGKGKPRGKPQKDDNATEVPDIGDRHRKAPWSMPAPKVHDRLRAYTPPGLLAYYSYRPVEILSGTSMEWVEAPYGTTGTYLGMRQGKLAVLCGDSTVFGIERLCRPGAEPQGASDFARTEELRVGDHFV